ncbi:hypothetical protein POM88_008897 [Heracleum sosnowskyi]|uniref:Phosphofructokinase domain-containing protein n=1 Tax=Heracleum sosnowskyi TaxID=360622 RepID=A0AAD8N6X5_9APIA|nr:hypothetical protein POM88_008897 [Heracleum sosnowskyi]
MYRLHRVPVQRTWPTLQFQSAYSLRNEARNLYIHNLGENMDWKWVCLIHLVLASKVIDRSGFDTAVEEAQRTINVAHVEAESAENDVGVVKLMGRYCGFIAMYATLASREFSIRLQAEEYITGCLLISIQLTLPFILNILLENFVGLLGIAIVLSYVQCAADLMKSCVYVIWKKCVKLQCYGGACGTHVTIWFGIGSALQYMQWYISFRLPCATEKCLKK